MWALLTVESRVEISDLIVLFMQLYELAKMAEQWYCAMEKIYFLQDEAFELFQRLPGKLQLLEVQIEFWAIKHSYRSQDSDKH